MSGKKRIGSARDFLGYLRGEFSGSERHEFERALEADLFSREALEGMDFPTVPGLSREAAEKLSRHRPKSLAEAARIPGVRDSDLTALAVHLRRGA